MGFYLEVIVNKHCDQVYKALSAPYHVLRTSVKSLWKNMHKCIFTHKIKCLSATVTHAQSRRFLFTGVTCVNTALNM